VHLAAGRSGGAERDIKGARGVREVPDAALGSHGGRREERGRSAVVGWCGSSSRWLLRALGLC
jgi:hypothetical protein